MLDDEASISIVGDIILEDLPRDTDVSAITELLQSDELTICSFEGALSDRGEARAKAIVVRTPIEVAGKLRDAGIHGAALANNHTTDLGVVGLTDTLENFSAAGISTAGAGINLETASAPAFFDTPAGRVAMLSVTCAFPAGAEATSDAPGVWALRINTSIDEHDELVPEQPGMALRIRTSPDESDLDRLLAAVSDARETADLVLVVIHWGIHPPWRPDAYGPLAEYQRPLGRALIDAGADAVLGNHAVELQGIEFYRERPIAYCLGVFWYDRLADFDWVGREAIVLRFHPASGLPPRVEVVPLLMDERGVPELDPSNRVIDLLKNECAPLGTSVVSDGERWVVQPAP